jgi:transposase
MNIPVLSIDVAKGKSVAAAFLSYHDCMYKPFPFSHTGDDLNHLLSILEQMKQSTGQEPRVVLEATGNYSKPLVSFFSSYGYSVIVLNPLLTHQLKQNSNKSLKSLIRVFQTFMRSKLRELFLCSTFIFSKLIRTV